MGLFTLHSSCTFVMITGLLKSLFKFTVILLFYSFMGSTVLEADFWAEQDFTKLKTYKTYKTL